MADEHRKHGDTEPGTREYCAGIPRPVRSTGMGVTQADVETRFEGLSAAVAEAFAAMRFEDLPAPVVEMTKSFLIDTFGVIGGAPEALGIPQLNARFRAWEPDGIATSLLGGHRMSPPSAALVNGAAAHALDYDNKHDVARVHANAVILPTVLAAAEGSGKRISGKDLILAMAIGTELHARLGLACHGSLSRGWHPTPVYGALAGAVAAGRLLGLTGSAMRDALGMAYHQASGSAQSIRDGVLSKRLGAGFAARAAVLSAFLAADGLTGTRRTLEGGAGLFSLYERGEVRPELILGDIGSTWRTLEYSFKPYPSCQANNSVISIGINCHAAGVRPESIDAVRIGLGRFNWEVVGDDYDAKRDDPIHAQFNAAYAFAAALVGGDVNLWSYQRPAITAPHVVALTARTRTEIDQRIEPSAIEPAFVHLKFRDGTEHEHSLGVIKGSPADPLSREALIRKFELCVEFGLGAEEAARAKERLIPAIEALEGAGDGIAALLPYVPRRR